MNLTDEYFRFLDCLGHERIVYIPKGGSIDSMLAEEYKENSDDNGFRSRGYDFTYVNP